MQKYKGRVIMECKENRGVGDKKSPPLMATEEGLRDGATQSEKIQAGLAKRAAKLTALNAVVGISGVNPGTQSVVGCRQTIWICVFFDGTGNNSDADREFSKHSNIAKLYAARQQEKPGSGINAIYIPGIGTYFRAIGDDGGSVSGKVAGAMGDARINYALMEVDKRLRRPLEMARVAANAIDEINVAVFGFSRGAALARAFVKRLLETRCQINKGKFTLRSGNWPLRIRFMGLFDTVASVGKPMSSNTTETFGAITANVERIIRKRLCDYPRTCPQSLAFAERGRTGADPAPGSANGHNSYGSELAIDEGVEEVRHFVAAHEIRNSFPVDSISMLRNGRITKPEHFYETVYPGVHSDVGGSYAPEEGGKSRTASEKFGVIPLIHMYQYALRAGVPLLNPDAWNHNIQEDFDVDKSLTSAYDYYIKHINAPGILGQVINNHMQLYYAWRFRSIRLKKSGDKTEAREIATASSKFKAASVPIDSKLATLQINSVAASIHVSDLESQIREYQMDGDNASSKENVERLRGELEQATARSENARQAMLKEKARKDALPDMTQFQALVDLYDRQLMLDVKAILDVLKIQPGRFIDRNPFTRADLRPHYRVLLEAYEAEFVHNKGLTDKTIIQFFDDYIHDSLAGFGADATIPSDPRVVYLGGDQKLAYASLETEADNQGNAQAA